MADLFSKAARELEDLATRHESVLVSYSGGKDSLACMELCCRFFRKVVGFHWSLCYGLQLTAERFAFARARWGVEVIEYPSGVFTDGLRNWIWGEPSPRWNSLPNVSGKLVTQLARHQTGIKLVVAGDRYMDFRNRRKQIKCQKDKNTVYPIREFSKAHVLYLLTQAGIPIPESHSNVSGGDDLSVAYQLWLHRRYPADFKLLTKYFPYLPAIVHRQRFFHDR